MTVHPLPAKSTASHHFQLGPVLLRCLCILDYYNNLHPGLKAGSEKAAAGRHGRLLPLQQFSENINPCTRHFAGSLMVSGSIFKGWGRVLRSTYVSRGNISNVCTAVMVSSSDSSSYHPKRIRSMGNSEAQAPSTPPFEAVPLLKEEFSSYWTRKIASLDWTLLPNKASIAFA